LQGSVSLGVVAGVDRDCPWDPSLKGLIQITAGVAGGSSGAPVLNSKAQVVGVVTAMSDFRRSGSQTGGPQAFVNALVAAGNMTKEEADRYLRFMQVAAAPAGAATQPMPPAAGGNQAGTFAIPINLVKEVLGEMAEGGMVRRASLGAVVGGVARSVAGGPLAPEGALVMSVEQGGAAARAGIQVGDCIIRFGDAWVEDGAHLSQLVAQKRPGAVVSVWVVRGTELLKPSVTLGVEKGVALPAPGKIAFTSNRDGNLEIYVMNSDGSNETNLTNNSAWDSEPSWSPH
jgi:S1-C subfamily serine protease